jgi:ADP-heptose:LPS heptosyltransferase
VADLLAGNDSGPLNIARAAGTATVDIYWIGNVINAGALTRTRHRPLASWQVECPACKADMIYEQCDHRESFVTGVSVEEVLFNAFDLLDRRSANPVAK